MTNSIDRMLVEQGVLNILGEDLAIRILHQLLDDPTGAQTKLVNALSRARQAALDRDVDECCF